MRINNPKSLAGFTLSPEVDEQNYRLATIGQVRQAMNTLSKEFNDLLTGIDPLKRGIGGYKSKCGYAWLNSQGKIDASLIPSLAITETHVVSWLELQSYNFGGDIYNVLDKWIKTVAGTESSVTPSGSIDDIVEGGTSAGTPLDPSTQDACCNDGSYHPIFQKGDIIIVTPEEIIDRHSTEDAGEAEGYDHPQVDPSKCGTYIITNVPYAGPDGGNYKFAKMAYHDSHIVKINEVVPENTLGEVKLTLKDVIVCNVGQKYSPSTNPATDTAFATDKERAAELENVLFGMARVKEEDGSFRFAFIDNKDTDNVTEIVPYARKRELDEEISGRIAADTDLENMINELRAHSDDLDSELSTSIQAIEDEIGSDDDLGVRTASGTLHAQLNALRNDVDVNATILDVTRHDTDILVNLLQDNIDTIYEALNQKAVTIIEQKFKWLNTDLVGVVNDSVPGLYSTSDADNELLPQGYVKWVHRYVPHTEDTTIDSASGKEYINSQNGNFYSDEKILAVYDAQGNELGVDLQRVTDSSPMATDIIVHVESNGTEGGGSLVGQEWTLLIAKRMIIDPVPLALPSSYISDHDRLIKVGGNEKANRTED